MSSSSFPASHDPAHAVAESPTPAPSRPGRNRSPHDRVLAAGATYTRRVSARVARTEAAGKPTTSRGRSHGDRSRHRGARAGPRGSAVLRSDEGVVQDRLRPEDEPGPPYHSGEI